MSLADDMAKLSVEGRREKIKESLENVLYQIEQNAKSGFNCVIVSLENLTKEKRMFLESEGFRFQPYDDDEVMIKWGDE